MSHSLRSLLNVLKGFRAAVRMATFNNVLAEYTCYRIEIGVKYLLRHIWKFKGDSTQEALGLNVNIKSI
jgi:hypothetical protein